jgi:hypothetical protein
MTTQTTTTHKTGTHKEWLATRLELLEGLRDRSRFDRSSSLQAGAAFRVHDHEFGAVEFVGALGSLIRL